MNDGLNHMHTRVVLILLIQLTAVTILIWESDYNISFRIPVVLVKWNEKTHLLNMYIYIYIFIFLSSDASLTRKSTKKKIHQRSWSRSFYFAEYCHIDVIDFLRFDDFMDEIVIKSSRKRLLNADVISKRWATTELCIIPRIRRVRFLEEWSLRNELDWCHQYIGL